MIVGVAVRIGGDLTLSMPKPYRHVDIWRSMYSMYGPKIVHCPNTVEGFVTAKGEFLTRTQAVEHARRSRQILQPTTKLHLYSEDLW